MRTNTRSLLKLLLTAFALLISAYLRSEISPEEVARRTYPAKSLFETKGPGKARFDTFPTFSEPTFIEKTMGMRRNLETWEEALPYRLDTAEKAFVLEQNFARLSPMEQRALQLKLEFNDALRRSDRGAGLDPSQYYEKIEAAAEAWKKNAQRGHSAEPIDLLKEAFPEAAKRFGWDQGSFDPKRIFFEIATDKSPESEHNLFLANELGVDTSVDPNRTGYRSPSSEKIYEMVNRAKKDAQFAEDLTKLAPQLASGMNLKDNPSQKILNADGTSKLAMESLRESLGMQLKLEEHSDQLKNQAELDRAVKEVLVKTTQATERLRSEVDSLSNRIKAEEQRRASEEKRQEEIARIDGIVAGPAAAARFLASLAKDPAEARALQASAVGLSAFGLMAKAGKGLIPPMAAIQGIGELIGSLFSIFGGPSIDEQILKEVKEVRKLLQEVYVNMMAQFGYLREAIDNMHRSLEARLDRLEASLRAELMVIARIGNETSSAVADLQRRLKNQAERDRIGKSEKNLRDFHGRVEEFQRSDKPQSGFDVNKFRDLYRECELFARDKCKDSEMTGSCVIFSENETHLTGPWYSTLNGVMSSELKTPEVIRAFSQACESANNPICHREELLANQICWTIASRALLTGADAHPKYYDQVHQANRREHGRDLPGETHSQIRTALREGRKLQRASHNVAWISDEKGMRLNRDFLGKLVDGHVAQINAVEGHVRARQEEFLQKTAQLHRIKAGQPAKELATKMPDVLTHCPDPNGNAADVKDVTVINLTPEQKEKLVELVPLEVQLEAIRKSGKIQFCIDPSERFEQWREQNCNEETFSRNPDKYSGPFKVRVCEVAINPVVILKGILSAGSDPELVFHRKIHVPNGHRTETRRYEDGKLVQTSPIVSLSQTVAADWERGLIPGVLFQNPRHPSVEEMNSELISRTVTQIATRIENELRQEEQRFTDQLKTEFGNKPTAGASFLLENLNTSKNLIQRTLDLGYETIHNESPHLANSMAAVEGMSEISAAIHRADNLAGSRALQRFFDERRRRAYEVIPALDLALREAEQDSIETFLKRFKKGTDPDRIAKAYAERYPSHSRAARVGRNLAADGVAGELEDRLIEYEGETARSQIATENAELKAGLTPSSLWGEPQAFPEEILPCDSEKGETRKLTEAERNQWRENLKQSARPEDWVAFRIGSARLSLCSKGEPPAIYASFGTDINDASARRQRSEYAAVTRGEQKLFVAGLRRSTNIVPDPAPEKLVKSVASVPAPRGY